MINVSATRNVDVPGAGGCVDDERVRAQVIALRMIRNLRRVGAASLVVIDRLVGW